MDRVQSEIRKTIKGYGKEIVKEKRFVYILSDYGVLKDLYAERRILMNMIEDGYSELIFDLASQKSDASLKICSYVSEMHNKYGYQIRKLITVFSWIIDGLGMKPVPFDAILRISNETDEKIKEVFIKGKFEVKDPKSEIAGYTLPSSNLFNITDVEQYDHTQILTHIKSVLKKYQIEIEAADIKQSPAMLFFDIQLISTIRLTKLLYLQDEIATSLAPIGCRLQVPIPGTNHIGIEYPIPDASFVTVGQTLSHKTLNTSAIKSAALPCLLGLQPNGFPLFYDLVEEANTLITGISGSGKSNCIHSIVNSMMCYLHPSQVKFSFIDFTNVEYSVYQRIANNFLVDFANGNYIVSSIENAIIFFKNLIKEIDFRHSLLASADANKISAYNQKFMSGDLNPKEGHQYLPYLVVIIDELTDLTNVTNISQYLSCIVKQGEEVGVHLVIATSSRIRRAMLADDIRSAFKARISFL